MPTNINVNDVIQSQFFNSLGNQQAINSVFYRCATIAGAAPTDQELATGIDAQAAPLYKAWMPAVATYRGVRVQIHRPILKPAVISTAAAGAGALAEEPLPPSATLLLSIRTAVAHRTARGRVYLPFWTEPKNDAGAHPTAGATALAAAWATGLLATLTLNLGGGRVSTFQPVVWSRKLVFAFDATLVLIRQEWATQRRRSLLNRSDTLGPQP